jgi:hypothetical protein
MLYGLVSRRVLTKSTRSSLFFLISISLRYSDSVRQEAVVVMTKVPGHVQHGTPDSFSTGYGGHNRPDDGKDGVRTPIRPQHAMHQDRGLANCSQ